MANALINGGGKYEDVDPEDARRQAAMASIAAGQQNPTVGPASMTPGGAGAGYKGSDTQPTVQDEQNNYAPAQGQQNVGGPGSPVGPSATSINMDAIRARAAELAAAADADNNARNNAQYGPASARFGTGIPGGGKPPPTDFLGGLRNAARGAAYGIANAFKSSDLGMGALGTLTRPDINPDTASNPLGVIPEGLGNLYQTGRDVLGLKHNDRTGADYTDYPVPGFGALGGASGAAAPVLNQAAGIVRGGLGSIAERLGIGAGTAAERGAPAAASDLSQAVNGLVSESAAGRQSAEDALRASQQVGIDADRTTASNLATDALTAPPPPSSSAAAAARGAAGAAPGESQPILRGIANQAVSGADEAAGGAAGAGAGAVEDTSGGMLQAIKDRAAAAAAAARNAPGIRAVNPVTAAIGTGAAVANEAAGRPVQPGEFLSTPPASTTPTPPVVNQSATATPITDQAMRDQAAKRAADAAAAAAAGQQTTGGGPAAAVTPPDATTTTAPGGGGAFGATTTTPGGSGGPATTTTNTAAPNKDPFGNTLPPGFKYAGSSADGKQIILIGPDGKAQTFVRDASGKLVPAAGSGQNGFDTGVADQGAGGAAAATSSNASLDSITQQLQQDLNAITQQLNQPGQAPDVTGVFMQQAKTILELIAQQEANLRAQAEKDGTTVDPSTQFALTQLQEALTKQLDATRADLNRRGLLESGVELQMETELRKGNMSDGARILAERLTRIQTNLSANLAEFSKQRITSMTTLGNNAAQAQATSEGEYQNRRQQQLATLLQTTLGLRGQMSNEVNEQANRQQQAQLAQASQRAAADLQQAQQAFQAAQNELQRNATAANQAAAQAAAAALQAAQQRFEAAQNAINIAAGKYDRSNSGSTDRAATQAAIDQIPVYGSRDEALAALAANALAMAAAGIDVNAVRNEIMRYNFGR